jgi:uncharacterized repeat protein (TIGR03803 family)
MITPAFNTNKRREIAGNGFMKNNTFSSHHAGRRFGKTIMALASGAMLLALSSPCLAAGRQTLRGHVPEAIARLGLQPIGRLPATNRLRLAIGLPLRDTNALNQMLQDMYDPASPQFRRYLTPEQFTEKFGPTQQDYDAVAQFAKRNGLEITTIHSNRVLLDVAGQVADVEHAFQITLRTYQRPREPRQFYAPDVEPSVDAGLRVLDISGLNNYSIPRPASHGASGKTGPVPASGSGPSGSYMGKDLRNAYAPGVTLTGAGQMVGLLEFQGFRATDITGYERMAGLPKVPIQNILLDGFNGTPTSSDIGECTIDIEMAIAMAPGLSNVVVFDAGPNGILNDILNAMAAQPQIKQFSSSWGELSQSATSDNIWKQMAAQGQSFFQDSNDADSWANNVDLATGLTGTSGFWPSDDPYLTSVGGTTLTMNGAGASYASEQVWNSGNQSPGWDGSSSTGSGGGVSAIYAIPSWQQGLDMSVNKGSTTMRNSPDVAMVADNLAAFYQGSATSGWSGTSWAAPGWAAFTALVNQEAAANGQPSVGFLNPALYAIGKSANYTNCFHDITVGNNATPSSDGLFAAVPSYDLCTGWGSPTGSDLIYALAFPDSLVVAPNSDQQLSGSVGGPFNPGAVSYSLTNSPVDKSPSLDWSTGLDAAWLSVSPTSGTNFAGAPISVVTVTPNLQASNLTAGSYTATLYFTNLNDHSVQNRQVSVAIIALPVITSQPTNQAVLEGRTTTFRVETASNALLSYQWQFNSGSGLTNLTDVGGISGSMTSSLTISNASPADVGSYLVVLSNVAGSVASSNAALTIISGQAPVILSEPSNQTILPGDTATFAVSAAGDEPLSYFWQLDGTNLTDQGSLSGSATSTLTIQSATPINFGNYSVLITNSFGSVTSTVAALNFTSITTAGVVLETLYSCTTNSIGTFPCGGLIKASNGSFYGTMAGGGSEGNGTVCQMDTNGVVTLVYAFPNGIGDNNPPDGYNPFGTLLQASNGLLYGTAVLGGASDDGTVFRMTTNGTGIEAWSLGSTSIGSRPWAGLVQGQNGDFYGTTKFGGANGYGTVFKLTPTGVLTGVHSFNNGDGAYPCPALAQGGDGNFYGATFGGGANSSGTIFKITPAGALTSLFSFAETNGALPAGALTQDFAGNFYGVTYGGGASGAGTVFKLGADGAFASLYSFTGGNDGANPTCTLLLAKDGNLYGTTILGGSYSFGTVFRISLDGALATLAQFDGYLSANPEGALVQDLGGNLYGTALTGGASGWGLNGLGAIFRLSLNGPLQITQQPQPQQAYASATVAFSVATFGSLPVSYQWRENGTNLFDGGNISGSSSRILTLSNISANNAATYSVAVSNVYGALPSAGAQLTVLPLPSISISAQGTNIVLTWSGGQPPYSVQTATSLASPAWQTIAGPMTNTTALVTPSNSPTFYRIQVE